MHNVLLTGATGYIGRRLEKVLREREDLRLRLLVRNTRKLTEKTRQHAEIIEGDSFSPETLRQALFEVDTAVYLIHSMGAERDFSQLDRESAEKFYNACLEQGVKRIVYLGGLGLRESASPHLASRLETGDILSSRPDRIRTIWLRAGVIIGSGSTSFEIIRHLVEKLPVMTTPKWVNTMTQPIGIEDVVAYLSAAISLDPPDNVVVDIGVAPISFQEMLQQTAEVMRLRRWIVPVPVLTPRLSSYWLTLMTPVPYRIGAALVEGLKSETLVQNDHAQRFFPQIQPQPFRETVQQALNELEQDLVISRWCDSSGGAVCDISDAASPADSVYRDVRIAPLQGIPAEHVFAAITSLGGKTGWFSHSLLWRTRGLIDKAVGGYGLNRGRRMHGELRIGDALDFWKVVDLVPGKRLLLVAQMRVPGKAWLEFDLQNDTLVQTAHFIPHGLYGRLYWYALIPFHYFIFPGLIKKILAKAGEMEQEARHTQSREV
ncbi:SDR family oxidoreductase [Desulfobulbus alkaliphilus]|uniref:SDR family oxidoreductase n=1 Tax=Desulfobulbus alkaliphilus TaxID=869814 RepID=UPI0019634BCE|nr:SDR family oxidoreductase [Desulfobulbus alkaliphilus]MBM9538010.1 SDR family oxidoreductase [Desulfobulbus alkaliphilus]